MEKGRRRITSEDKYGEDNTILLDGPMGISRTVENIAGLPPMESEIDKLDRGRELSTDNMEFMYTVRRPCVSAGKKDITKGGRTLRDDKVHYDEPHHTRSDRKLFQGDKV